MWEGAGLRSRGREARAAMETAQMMYRSTPSYSGTLAWDVFCLKLSRENDITYSMYCFLRSLVFLLDTGRTLKVYRKNILRMDVMHGKMASIG